MRLLRDEAILLRTPDAFGAVGARSTATRHEIC
jgi:hypothetical protein